MTDIQDSSLLGHQDRRHLYRFVISKFLQDDWKVAHRLLNIVRCDKELSDEETQDIIGSLFEGHPWDPPEWFALRFSDAISYQERNKCFELLREYVDKKLGHSEGANGRILKLCHGVISDYMETGSFDSAASWSKLALELPLRPSGAYDHFLDLLVRSLYASKNATGIKELYLEHKGHLHLSYFYLLMAFREEEYGSEESMREALLNIKQSKQANAEGISKLVLYDILQQTLPGKETVAAQLPKMELALHIIKDILAMTQSDKSANDNLYLYQYMIQLMTRVIEISPLPIKEEKIKEYIKFWEDKAINNIQDCPQDVQNWFEQMLFNLGLLLGTSSQRILQKAAFDVHCLNGSILFKNRSSLNQMLSCLVATDLGQSLDLIEETWSIINKALIIAESLSEEDFSYLPNILSTIHLKRVQIALYLPNDPYKKVMSIIDECLQEIRLPGETMEYMAHLLRSRKEFQRPRIRCLKSALNKHGINHSDLSHGIHVFIELFKELLSPKETTLPLPEIKAILNKLEERLRSEKSELSSSLQDHLLQILGNLWNTSWKLELRDGHCPYVKVLRQMATSNLLPFIESHKDYLAFKISNTHTSNS